nr:TBC1 domain family member 31-like isoform X2 [Styela clava]
MLELDLTGKTSGRIWSRKPNPYANNGVICSISHSGIGVKSGKRYRILKSSFVAGHERLIVGDHLGIVYLFDLVENRFSIIQNTGQACTCIATGLQNQSEYLIALSDTSLKCCSTETKELISWMRGHDTAVHTISINDDGNVAITTSQDTAQLWDIETFERKRKLNVMTSVGIRKVFFIPQTNLIMTCFRDNTIFAWDAETLEWKYQLKCNSQADPIDYRSYAVTRNGKTLVAAGKSNLLHVYSLETLRIIRIVQMPPHVTSVKDILFLPDKFDNGANKILGVISQDGIVQFIDLETCRLVFEIVSPRDDDRIMSISISSVGEHIAAITLGGSLVFYDVSSLCADLNKPPGPLVKVVGDIWKHKVSVNTGTSLDVSKFPDSTMQQTARRPLNNNVTTGRIRYNKFVEDETVRTEDDLPNGLSKSRLLKVLKGHGEYPEQYRMFIWRSMLQLPENTSAFSALVKKGTHLSYAALQDQYPIKSGRLQRILQKILSALAHWSVIFAELDSLPSTVFPFVKLFQNNHLICFEMVATFLINWCQHWFEFFPNPPLGILSAVENVLAHHDKKLLHHFIKFKVTTQHYAWPLLQTLFTEVFTRAEWLKFFDHILSNDPSFILYGVVAYCTSCRAALLRTDNGDDIKFFFHNRNSLDLNAVIRETYHLMESTPKDIEIQSLIEPFKPLPNGTAYPVFNKYPKFIVDYQARERERIKKDEIEYLRERKVAEELAQEISNRKLEDEAWYQKQEMLSEAEEKRRKILMDEDQKLGSQRMRLAAMKRELRVRELQLLDAARLRFVQHQQMKKETDIQRLEDEIQRTARLREQETAAAIEDVEIEGLELEGQRIKLEQQMAQHEADLTHKNQDKVQEYRHQQNSEAHTFSRLQQKQTDAELKSVRKWEERIAKKELQRDATKHQAEVIQQHILDTKQRERDLERVLGGNAEHRKQHGFINEKLRELLDAKDSELHKAREELVTLEKELLDAKEERIQAIGREKRNVSQYERIINDTNKEGDCEQTRMSFPNSRCLNSLSTETEESSSSLFTTDRGRMTFEEREKQLMNEVRELRQRLVSQHVRRDPPPTFKYK